MEYILSICIPVFNKKNFTISCLKDLMRLPENHQIIIIDNNSTDGTQQAIEEEIPKSNRFIYRKLNSNVGFGKASNLAYTISSGKNIMFLNNDIRVNDNHSSWTQEIIKYCDDYIVGPTMGELNDNFNFVREANQILNSKYSYMSGWCLSSSKQNFEKLKLSYEGEVIDGCQTSVIFDEKYSPAYFEDTDLSMRAKMLNIPFKVIDVPVHHFGRITSKQLNTAALYNVSRQKFINTWRSKNVKRN